MLNLSWEEIMDGGEIRDVCQFYEIENASLDFRMIQVNKENVNYMQGPSPERAK